jgi:hypothetical protein
MKDRGKYLARQRRYNRSEKDRARSERYEAKFIRIPEYLGSTREQPPIRVPRTPENETRVKALLRKREDFLFKQAREAKGFSLSLGKPH